MTDVAPLARIDSFPYRHRVGEVMVRSVITATAAATVWRAAELMDNTGKGSLVVVDAGGRAIGIVTERDLVRLTARHRGTATELTLGEVMTQPLHTLTPETFLFVALARMQRLGLRHLVVVDPCGRPVGMVSARTVLKLRTSEALILGDGIAAAEDAAALDRARRALPDLAANLLADGVSAAEVAAVISSAVRDLTARAAELAQRAMAEDGWGPAPARWALLVLGSAGRGECLLAFDQDNAIVHDGSAADDPWFAEIGRRVADLLDAAGLPYCEGEVMARSPAWRRSLADWRGELLRWVHRPDPDTVMYTDIFFDLQPVHGDVVLAEELRRLALDITADAPFFLTLLTHHVTEMEVPIGLFGEFVTTHGRLNVKKQGLLPLISAARARALQNRLAVTGTRARYAALAAAGKLHADDFSSLCEAHETILRVMLEQQLADLHAGVPPTARIEPRRFDRATQKRLRAAFRRIRLLKTMIAHMAA